jgi:hypothetical protein
MHHLDVCGGLSNDVEAKPLVKPSRRVLMKDLETHRDAALRGLSQDPTNYLAAQAAALRFRCKLDASQEHFVVSTVDPE